MGFPSIQSDLSRRPARNYRRLEKPGKAFTQAQLDRLLALARTGIERLTAMQRETLKEAGVTLPRK